MKKTRQRAPRGRKHPPPALPDVAAARRSPTMWQCAIWLPYDSTARADRLIAPLSRDPLIAATGKVTRSVVLRVAVLRGLDALEKEYT